MSEREAAVDLLVCCWLDRERIMAAEHAASSEGREFDRTEIRGVMRLYGAMEQALAELGDQYIVHDLADALGRTKPYVVEIRGGRCDVAPAQYSDRL